MVYQGSKNKLAKFLVPIIQKYIDDNNIKTYIEPMVGGCNLIDKIKCDRKIGADINEELITLLKYVQTDNAISIAPETCTFEHYAAVREDRKLEAHKYSTEYIALIGYMASYGGRYFDGGYGRDSKGGRSIYNERLNNFRKQAPLLNDIEFLCCNYNDFANYENCLFYFDPPYFGTKQYSRQSIDYNSFYDFLRKLSENNIVLVSEYGMPDDFTCIWQKERKVLQKSDRITGEKAVEKLFTLRK